MDNKRDHQTPPTNKGSREWVDYNNLPDIDIKHRPLILCEAMNDLIPDNVKGAQLITGIWSIWLRSPEIKNYLLEGKFYATNYVTHKTFRHL